jgi:hypothetical protein
MSSATVQTSVRDPGHVLVIEPASQRREQLRTALERLNFTVSTSGSIAAASKALSRTRPDFIVVGLTLQTAQPTIWPSDIPVVVLTDKPPTVADYKAAIKAGATLVLPNAAATEPAVLAHQLRHGPVVRAAAGQALPYRPASALGVRSSMLGVSRPDLHDAATGRLDARLIADALGVKFARLVRALGAAYKAVYKTPTAPRLQRQLVPIKQVLARLSEVYADPSHQRAWLNEPLDDLEGETPLHVILRGQAQVVAELLDDVLVGQPM